MKKNKFICITLLPLSLLYSAAMSFRNYLYDKGIFSSAKKNVPVISIGNITTGGTGKTPLTIWITEYLLKKGRNVAVISRGYGRESANPAIVCDGNSILADLSQSGDELLMISEELLSIHRGNFVVAAGSNRSETIDFACKQFDVDIVVLDDAFQHRGVARDLDIVLINAEDYYEDDCSHKWTIPSGNLREKMSCLDRAGMIIQNNKGSNYQSIKFIEESGKEHLTMRYKSEYFVDMENVILRTINEDVILFSGLADNESFFSSVMELHVNVADKIGFEDHHNYTDADLDILKRKFTGKEVFVTSQKDFIKIKRLRNSFDEADIVYLKIKPEFGIDIEKFTNKIDRIAGI